MLNGKELIKEIKIVNGKDVTANMLIDAVNLDWATYNDEYHITKQQAKDYLEKNPYIYFMSLHKDKLVGYINFSPITKEMYERIKTGEFIDTIIEKKDMLIYENNKEYFNYFSSIVVDKNYQGFGIANKMIEALKQFIIFAEKEKNIKIVKIIADVLNDGGMKVVSKLGLKKIKKSNHNSIIAEWVRENEK